MDFGLSLFGADPYRARAAYARFLSQDAADPGGRASPDWEFAAEPKALPLEEMSLPQDLAIASLPALRSVRADEATCSPPTSLEYRSISHMSCPVP
jgi:hypothetical protein